MEADPLVVLAKAAEAKGNQEQEQEREQAKEKQKMFRRLSVFEMCLIMRVYGPEESLTKWPEDRIRVGTERSIRRMFQRTNPNFFTHFKFNGYSWVPVLPKEEEIERRRKHLVEALKAHKLKLRAKRARKRDDKP